ncbi:MAG TPA: hypothetical protein VFV50_11245 [Bdellovibrionales bacterium]|nr:hypothetical protein [Bdellovibrionales bacterium]
MPQQKNKIASQRAHAPIKASKRFADLAFLFFAGALTLTGCAASSVKSEPSIQAGDTDRIEATDAGRIVRIADVGTFVFAFPGAWRMTRDDSTSPVDMPVKLSVLEMREKNFSAGISVMRPARRDSSFTTLERIETLLREDAKHYESRSHEKKAVLEKVDGPHEGLRFTLTNTTPGPGDFAVMKRGILSVGEVLVVYSVFHNAGSEAEDGLKAQKAIESLAFTEPESPSGSRDIDVLSVKPQHIPLGYKMIGPSDAETEVRAKAASTASGAGFSNSLGFNAKSAFNGHNANAVKPVTADACGGSRANAVFTGLPGVASPEVKAKYAQSFLAPNRSAATLYHLHYKDIRAARAFLQRELYTESRAPSSAQTPKLFVNGNVMSILCVSGGATEFDWLAFYLAAKRAERIR